ncbi:MAG: hypothetical protein DMF60_04305 [Acidobacteria bacterium]|nr:MAG: hypothetical protein DMF60_04305 [Acidobacteriota bacterium]
MLAFIASVHSTDSAANKGRRAECSQLRQIGDSKRIDWPGPTLPKRPGHLKGVILRILFSSLHLYQTESFWRMMQESSNADKSFFPDSPPVNLLSTACRAEFAAADQQGATLSHEHPAILASDQLSRPSAAGRYARATADTRRRKNPPDKANCEVGQNRIDYKSEKHWSET